MKTPPKRVQSIKKTIRILVMYPKLRRIYFIFPSNVIRHYFDYNSIAYITSLAVNPKKPSSNFCVYEK